MRLFETNENEAVEFPTPRNDEAKTFHFNIKIYNPVMELTTVRAQERVYVPTYGTLVAIGQQKHEGRLNRTLKDRQKRARQ